MINVYESVDNNIKKSWLIITGFVIFVVLSVYLIGLAISSYYGVEYSGFGMVGLAFIISGLMSFASYYYSDKIILTISTATPADKKSFPVFYSVAENMSLAAKLPMPKLYVIKDTAMNAFATGRDPNHAVICATTGLLSSLNRTELEGVIGHEMSHVANYDTRLMSIVTILIGLITLLADWLFRIQWYGRGRDDSDNRNSLAPVFILIGILMAIISPIIAQLIQLAISRRREFLADASSVKYTRQPSGLISALKKISMDREPLEAANKATAHLYISDPLKNQKNSIARFSEIFNTHPPVSQRIQMLEQMA